MKMKRPDWSRRHDSDQADERVFLKLNTFRIVRYPADAVPQKYENPRKKQPVPCGSAGHTNQLDRSRTASSHNRRHRGTVEDTFTSGRGGSDSQPRRKRKFVKRAAKGVAKSPLRVAGWTFGNALITTLYSLNKVDDAVLKTKDWKRQRRERKGVQEPASSSPGGRPRSASCGVDIRTTH